MSTTATETSPLRYLINILSDAFGMRVGEGCASANLEFPTINRPFREKYPTCQSDPDVDPLASVVVVATDESIISARPPVQAILDVAQLSRTLACYLLHVMDVVDNCKFGRPASVSTFVCGVGVAKILRKTGPQVSLRPSPTYDCPSVLGSSVHMPRASPSGRPWEDSGGGHRWGCLTRACDQSETDPRSGGFNVRSSASTRP